MGAGTVLVVVTTSAVDAAAIAQWIAPQLPEGDVAVATGYYAGVSAVDRRARAAVVDIGTPTGRDDWRLAELRARVPEAAFVVVAESEHIDHLAAPLHADLAVTRTRDLPPLRELLVTDEHIDLSAAEQAMARRPAADKSG